MIARHPQLETRTARLRLRPCGKPYRSPPLAPGIHLDYRRCERGAGTWIVRVARKGSYWTKGFAIADDVEDADGESVLSFWQAQNKARVLARGGNVGGPLIETRRKFLAFIERGTEPACYLYRHYHPSGDLLYVGISLFAIGRQLAHFRSKDWRYEIHQIVIEPFATREQALAAERRAIETEFPKFNGTHNQRRHPLQELARVQQEGA